MLWFCSSFLFHRVYLKFSRPNVMTGEESAFLKHPDTAKLRIWTLRFWVFRAQDCLPRECGDAPRLFLSSKQCLGADRALSRGPESRAPKTPNHQQWKPPLGTARNMPSVINTWSLAFAKVPHQGRTLYPSVKTRKEHTWYRPRGTSRRRTCGVTLRLCKGTVPGGTPGARLRTLKISGNSHSHSHSLLEPSD